MRKEMKQGRKYFLINIDEPYAKKIYAVLKEGQMAKGEWPEGVIDFEEWKRQTFEGRSNRTKEIKTTGEQISDLERRIGHLEYMLSCLGAMSQRAREDCQHEWVEEVGDLPYSTTVPMSRKMRCRKCLLVQYVY